MTSCKNAANVLQKEKEELEKDFASLQQEMASMSTAVIQRATLEDNEQLLAAKQEAAHWEESYNCLLQEKENFQNDLVEIQDKLANIQAEYERSQRELMSSSKNYKIKVSKMYFVLRSATTRSFQLHN